MLSSSKRIAGLLLAGVAGLALATGAASANPIVSVTYTASAPVTSTDWSTSLSVPKFNPALGTLLSTQVNLTGNLDGSLKVANSQTFTNVIGSASAATPSTAGFSNTAHTVHCTAASTSCSIWNITYTSSPPATIPTNTINSTLSATITLHVGSNLIVVLPAANVSDTFDAGPKTDPATYSFTKQYGASNGSSTVITKTTALAKTISGTGIQSPGVVPPPSGVYTSNPCNEVYGPCTVGSHTYNVGKFYTGLNATASNSALYTLPGDLALFTGLGVLILPIDAAGDSSHTGGANVDFESTAEAGAGAIFTYTYIQAPEPITLSLFGAGLLGAGVFRRRRKSKAV